MENQVHERWNRNWKIDPADVDINNPTDEQLEYMASMSDVELDEYYWEIEESSPEFERMVLQAYERSKTGSWISMDELAKRLGYG